MCVPLVAAVAFIVTSLCGCAGARQDNASPAAVTPAPVVAEAAPAPPVSGLSLQTSTGPCGRRTISTGSQTARGSSSTQIPADKSEYGAFTILRDGSEQNLHAIAEEDAKAGAPAGSDTAADRRFLSQLHGRGAGRPSSACSRSNRNSRASARSRTAVSCSITWRARNWSAPVSRHRSVSSVPITSSMPGDCRREESRDQHRVGDPRRVRLAGA